MLSEKLMVVCAGLTCGLSLLCPGNSNATHTRPAPEPSGTGLSFP